VRNSKPQIHAAIVFAPGMTRQDDYHWKMDTPEQAQWLATQIQHRVRAAIARLPMENSILLATATIDPQCRTERDRIYWRKRMGIRALLAF
jgi:hypothetical protein